MNLRQLTFTRFVAASWVVAFHYGASASPFQLSGIKHVVAAGPVAVSYFFVLSGFIMAVVYRNRFKAPGSASQYWAARIARIYPVYLLALAVVLTLTNSWHSFLSIGLTAALVQAWSPTYALAVNSPAWSLSVEAFFYLLLPFLLVRAEIMRTRSLLLATLVFWAAGQVLHTMLLNGISHQAGSPGQSVLAYNPVFHLSSFVFGMTAGICALRWHREAHQGLIALIAGAATLIAVLICLYHGELVSAAGFPFWIANGLVAPAFALGIAALALHESAAARWLKHPFAVLLGEASYAIYLLQIPVWMLLAQLLGLESNVSATLYFYTYVVVLIAVSVIVYLTIEKPARALLRHRWLHSEPGAVSGPESDNVMQPHPSVSSR